MCVRNVNSCSENYDITTLQEEMKKLTQEKELLEQQAR
jgi:hypothetical protein